MKIWLVQTGEPVPIDPGEPKLMRTGVLAHQLAHRGHDVVLWCATVNHAAKLQRASRSTVKPLRNNYKLVLLYGRLYKSNMSIARVVSQAQNAREFRRLASELAKPDVILCGYPTIELAYAATQFAKNNGVPIAIDFRDKWPDIIEEHVPGWARPAAIPLFAYWRHCQRWTIQNSTGIVAISEPFLDWALAVGYRTRGRHDRVFHLASDPIAPTPNEIAKAELMWQAHDVPSNAEHTIVCYAGTLSSRLDLMTFVDGFLALAREQRKRIKLVLCGQGDLYQDLRHVAEHEPNLIVPGWCNAAELHVLMRRATIGILPYRSKEDFIISYPNKVGEYLSAGLPILTGLTGLVRTLLISRDIGYFYQEGVSASVAYSLSNLLANPAEAQKKRGAAYQTFADLFNPARIYPDFCDYLEQLAGDKLCTATAQRAAPSEYLGAPECQQPPTAPPNCASTYRPSTR